MGEKSFYRDDVEVVVLPVDVVVVGGGTAGCMAAITVKEKNPDLEVLVVEKAHVSRSGCLAAGVNAINAYLNPGETPESYLEYVRKEGAGLVREDLVYTIGQRLNHMAARLEEWGLPFLRDAKGRYKARGRRSVEIIGEGIKPLMARALTRSGARVLNRVAASAFILQGEKVAGIYAFSVREKKFYVIPARAVICATGGAAGLYRPNNPVGAPHKMWYCPFNVGTGLAMGIRAGAEMTTLEMRFVALRVKDVISPTGTVAQGVKARQINALGEEYLRRYPDRTTAGRLAATLREEQEGRGPCYLDLSHLTPEENRRVKEAYLNMSPGIVLKWADEGGEPSDQPLEICGTEPYIVGGHGQAGYWVDRERRTTLKGLFAAGDVVGGAPKKYVTGCMAEGEMAGEAALAWIEGEEESPQPDLAAMEEKLRRVFAPLRREKGFQPADMEERLQKIMDEYAGGITAGYAVCEPRLLIARKKLRVLQEDAEKGLIATDPHELMLAHEVLDRIILGRAVVEHLLYRRETRWPVYQQRSDYPQRDDERWLVFVNSIYEREKDEFHMIERRPERCGDGLWR
ncbi:MAG: adenylylsulfate reductase, subunit [Eubacteriales bacterium]|nr:adenylylsulfate reductase, subunit [Eubacteriales bacterium]